MLDQKDEVDVEVSWGDQKEICKFSTLNALSHELDDRITIHKVYF
jgi:hypothetical protein